MYPCQMNQLSLEHSTAGSVSHGVITLSNQSWPLLLLVVNHQAIRVRSEHQFNNRRNHGFHQNSSWGGSMVELQELRIGFSLSCQICEKMSRSRDGMRKHENRKHPPGQQEVRHCATTGSIRAHQGRLYGEIKRMSTRSLYNV